MSEQLYRWVKASERLPEVKQNESWAFCCKHKDGYYRILRYGLSTQNYLTTQPYNWEWLEEYSEPLPLNADVEQAAKKQAKDYIDMEFKDQEHITTVEAKAVYAIGFIAGAGYGKEDSTKLCAPDDYQMKRLYDWIMDENRRKAGSFFTAGWTRNVAKEIEFRIQKVSREEIAQICEMADNDYAGQEAVMFAEWYESIRYSNYKINPEYFDFEGEGSGLKVKLKPFADLYCIFKEIPSRPSIDIVNLLREAFNTNHNHQEITNASNVWNECCDMLAKLLTQNK